MTYKDKTKELLINELAELHQRIEDLEEKETKRKQAEEALKVSETRYRRLFEAAQDGILLLDADYEHLVDKRVYRDEWDSLLGRLDALGDEINRSLGRTTRMEEPRNADRIVALQRRIDDGRMNGRLSPTEGRGFQARLDVIRSDYLRMTEGGRYASQEERTDISRRLDLLETDLNRFR